ncbi:MFS transporter [[Bacillus] enclensis]|uniref:Predicted arabinose efflux permease, MFS family n=1 Tax=[Bacillus] enclensis TaxID=1402860 RepID=A0A0V8HQN9_9BACI|nr:MFS transporter [[Bacillus] enclensis]KSU64448.1 MFS transporter [[Bacillus] enclensis]SCB74276.1 Predicted arabinose efflux permease, MFS family [[Bacillus] enclensis]
MESTSLGKNKHFITLMTAQAISSLGDWLSIVAIITLVGLKWEATPMQMSFIILSLALPMALLGPVSGTVADRMERKTLMIVSDVIRGGLILLLTLASNVWMVYVCLFLIGIFSSVFVPAKNGKLKELVPDDAIKGAMSLTSMIDSSTKVIGPLVSGILVTAVGTYNVFYIDSATFFISALLIFTLPKAVRAVETADEKEKKEKGTAFKEELKVGFQFLKKSTFLMYGLFLMGISLLILQLSDSQIIVLLRQLTDASPDLFGYTVTGSGIGMLITGIFLSKKTDYNAFIYMCIGVLGIGLGFGVMGILTYYDAGLSLVWMPALGLFAGGTAALVFIPFQAAVQEKTPVNMTGRVFGVINSTTTTATIIGPLAGGALATVIGIIPSFIVTGSLLIVLFAVSIAIRKKVAEEENHVTESKPGTQGAAT